MSTHRHRPAPTQGRLRAFTGCVAPFRCEPVAHGNVTYRDVCACGATRDTNSNAGHSERSPWQERTDDETTKP